jgi:putative ABC transport system ATP-binding protein
MTHDASTHDLSTPVASARGLVRTFSDGGIAVHALRGIDIDIPRGAFTSIMGPSGCGKSTLMHCLAGLDKATAGTVTVDGNDLGALDDDTLTRFRRDRVGFVFQAFNLLPMLTARQNILLPLELAGRRVDETLRERVRELAIVLGVADRLDHRPAALSGGQQQRVAIARALITLPAIVFADEPTGSLDSATAADILSYLRRSARELGQSIVMVTHDAVAARYADHVITMRDGRVA